eukprot:2221078-Amphidinium_carterae.2
MGSYIVYGKDATMMERILHALHKAGEGQPPEKPEIEMNPRKRRLVYPARTETLVTTSLHDYD